MGDKGGNRLNEQPGILHQARICNDWKSLCHLEESSRDMGQDKPIRIVLDPVCFVLAALNVSALLSNLIYPAMLAP